MSAVTTKRWSWGLVAWGIAAALAGSLASAAHAADEPGNRSVLSFGAIGDSKADDTAAFQKALDTVGRESGGIVRVPTGNYLIKGHLTVHDNVTLEGVFRAPTARSQFKGSTLLAVEGRGSEAGDPFIKLNANAGLKGITVMYPEQDAEKPVAYPWCIRGEGDNVTVTDVLLVNPWNGVDLGTFPCGRHLVRGLYGQPLHTGLFVDVCLDCGRLEDIHFWPFWTEKLIPFTRKNATAFIFARTDWEMLTNVFCLGYKVGFHMTALRTDAGNGLILNSGADVCDVGVLVEYSQVHAGFLFTNCQINAGIEVREGSLGPVKFVNCGIFATGYQQPHVGKGDARAVYASLNGQGRATFIGCHFYWPGGPFVPKDWKDEGLPGIYTNGNGLTIDGCDFTDMARRHLLVGPKAKSVIVTATRFKGGLKLEKRGKARVVTGQNIRE